MANPKTIAEVQRLQAAGYGRSYAYLLARGKRQPLLPAALEIYRKTGLKYGALANATSGDLKALQRLEARAA